MSYQYHAEPIQLIRVIKKEMGGSFSVGCCVFVNQVDVVAVRTLDREIGCMLFESIKDLAG